MRTVELLAAIFLPVAITLGPAAANAGDWCQHSRQLEAEIDLRGIDRIEVLAVSGDLSITGSTAAEGVTAKGRACVDKRYRDRLSEFRIVEERSGSTLRVIAFVPYRSESDDWRVGGLDLTLTVPHDLPLSVTDSSGDIDIQSIHSLVLSDSSGDIRLDAIKGDILIERDSSGDIDVRNSGAVNIAVDSSGDIDVRRAASLVIGKDSSGSINAKEIEGDVRIGADSSGEIVVSNVGGDFTVERDGSGGIRHRRVAGRVLVPVEY